jgi:GT2 family glycosyltransferase
MRYALDHGCDYVFLLNQDPWIEPNSIKELVRIHQEYPEYGLLSPMHINAEKTHLNILLDDGKNNYEMLSDLYFNSLQNVYTITYANAAAWLLPRKTLETIGGFCPMFFYCGEDDDYMNRLKFHKIQMGICPSLTIVHDSKYRLDESARLASKAAREGLYEILNINITNEPINLLCYYLRKWVLNLLRGDNKARKFCVEKIKFIGSNLRKLKDIRSKHRKQSTHWL